jgi:hypothetical protein
MFLFGRTFARLVMLLGVAVVAGGGLWAWSVDQRRAAMARAEGTVVGHLKVRHGEAERFHPQVSFKTRAGAVQRFTSRAGTAEARPEIGAAVRVLYNPLDPAAARIDAWREHWLGPSALGFVGAAFALLGFAAARFASRRVQ